MELEKSAAFKAQLGEERESNLLLGALDPPPRLDWTVPLSAVTLRLFAAGGHAVASAPMPTCAERALGGSRAAAPPVGSSDHCSVMLAKEKKIKKK